jgi:type I restriction enzyme M protein
VEGVARVVTLDEIARNDHNLNIARYIEPRMDEEVLSVADAMEKLRQSAGTAIAAENNLIAILMREGILRKAD